MLYSVLCSAGSVIYTLAARLNQNDFINKCKIGKSTNDINWRFTIPGIWVAFFGVAGLLGLLAWRPGALFFMVVLLAGKIIRKTCSAQYIAVSCIYIRSNYIAMHSSVPSVGP